jgi:aldehyde dehydrogenase (NAD+)
MTLPDATRFYIDGTWTAPQASDRADIVNPATGTAVAQIALGSAADAERAIAAARGAFAEWSATPVAERIAVLERILGGLVARQADIGDAIMAEMGAPHSLAHQLQAAMGPAHFAETIRVAKEYAFETTVGATLVQREAIGVCVLITPWNWPMNQVAAKVAPALAAGCTMVLKPSELAPLSAVILAEIIDEAGLPRGVFNMVHGRGPDIGDALTAHPDVDMVSFTGSTRAGIAIGRNGADTIKRVSLELGGKSANIIAPDADFEAAIPASVAMCMRNSGQSCNAPTRLLVPRDRLDEVADLARSAAAGLRVGAPDSDPDLGPIANETQYRRVLAMIEKGESEGATLIAGGAQPVSEAGYFVAPTIFSDVTPDMTIAREEVFGPVLSIIAYDDIDQAIAIANDSEYGLSGYVWAADQAAGTEIARRLRTGMVHVNDAGPDVAAPFGGYKMSGNGREWGIYGLEEFLEVKSIFGGA